MAGVVKGAVGEKRQGGTSSYAWKTSRTRFLAFWKKRVPGLWDIKDENRACADITGRRCGGEIGRQKGGKAMERKPDDGNDAMLMGLCVKEGGRRATSKGPRRTFA